MSVVCQKCGQIDAFGGKEICFPCQQEQISKQKAEPQYEKCTTCDGWGEVEHYCGEDTCCCLDTSDDICAECNGSGSVEKELSDDN